MRDELPVAAHPSALAPPAPVPAPPDQDSQCQGRAKRQWNTPPSLLGQAQALGTALSGSHSNSIMPGYPSRRLAATWRSPCRATPSACARLFVMRHPIDPKIDCVFKALLGAEDNRVLLIHFLNALLGRELPARSKPRNSAG